MSQYICDSSWLNNQTRKQQRSLFVSYYECWVRFEIKRLKIVIGNRFF